MSAPTTELGSETALVDDELVAVAAARGGVWPGPLPTVAMDEPGAPEAAAIRGLRSLAVRGAIDEQGRFPDSLETLFGRIVHQERMITVYLGDADGRLRSWGVGIGLIDLGKDWILDETNATGVHRLRQLNRAELSDFLVSLFEVVLAKGVSSPEPSISHACLSVGTAAEVTVLVVGAGSLNLVQVSDAGEPETSRLTAEQLRIAIQDLVGLR